MTPAFRRGSHHLKIKHVAPAKAAESCFCSRGTINSQVNDTHSPVYHVNKADLSPPLCTPHPSLPRLPHLLLHQRKRPSLPRLSQLSAVVSLSLSAVFPSSPSASASSSSVPSSSLCCRSSLSLCKRLSSPSSLISAKSYQIYCADSFGQISLQSAHH